MSEVFTFVDATHLIAKASLWQEKDEAIKQKYEKLNNETLPKVVKDKDAKIGCKGDKFWYGYKQHVSVDIVIELVHGIWKNITITWYKLLLPFFFNPKLYRLVVIFLLM